MQRWHPRRRRRLGCPLVGNLRRPLPPGSGLCWEAHGVCEVEWEHQNTRLLDAEMQPPT